MRQRMAASAMASPEELAAVLGITLNQAYGVLKHRKVRAMRLKQRWLIPRTEIERLKNGDVSEILGGPVLHLIGDAPAPTSP
jgi:DNA-binding Xre family transcriptional regulator